MDGRTHLKRVQDRSPEMLPTSGRSIFTDGLRECVALPSNGSFGSFTCSPDVCLPNDRRSSFVEMVEYRRGSREQKAETNDALLTDYR